MADKRATLIRAGWVLATLLLGAGAYVLGLKIVEDRVGTPAEVGGDAQGEGGDEVPTEGGDEGSDEMVELVDENAGFSISIPGSWIIVQNNMNQRLPAQVVSLSDGGRAVADDELHERLIAGPSVDNGISLRVRPTLGTEIPPASELAEDLSVEELQIMQGFIDANFLPPNLPVAEKMATNVNDMLAWRYIYPIKDSATGQEGIHLHYFIFGRNKVVSLVFQAIPSEELRELAPTFDEVLNSFTSETIPAAG